MNLNKEGGGTNIPNFINNIQFAKGGGMVGGLMGSSTNNNRFGNMLPMNPEPIRRITLPLKSLMMISDEKSSETSSDTQMSAGVSMKSTSAVRYNDNMMQLLHKE